MESKDLSYIRYEWETKRASLDFEIGKAESQLRSLEKRLRMLKLDVIISILFCAVPYCLILLVQFLQMLSSSTVLFFLELVYNLLLVVYIISLPFSTYQLIKCILLLFYHKHKNNAWQKPRLRSDFFHRNTSREESYNTEANKLNWVLAKYYIYRDEMDRMKKSMENEDFRLTYEETKNKLDKMEYYEEIKPANPFVGRLVKKTRIITVLLLGGLLLILYLTLL